MSGTTITILTIIAAAAGVGIWFAIAKWRAYRKGRADERRDSLAQQAEDLVDEQKRQRVREKIILEREREIAGGVSAPRAAELLHTWPDKAPTRGKD